MTQRDAPRVGTGHMPRRSQPGPRVAPPNAPEPPPMNDEFLTQRLDIAAFLMCRGQMVLRFKRLNGRVMFYFADQAACTELQAEYMVGAGQVPARVFFANMEWARQALHQV